MPFTRSHIGRFDVDLAREFFQGFVNHALVTLHIDNLRGENSHHQCETVFKAFGRALRMAVEHDPRNAGVVPSTQRSEAHTSELQSLMRISFALFCLKKTINYHTN